MKAIQILLILKISFIIQMFHLLLFQQLQKLIQTKEETDNLVLTYSPRAKKMLEVAYKTASEHHRPKVKSENLLYGITKMPNCLAMQVLTNLGTDILEIQQGIKQELLGGMDL